MADIVIGRTLTRLRINVVRSSYQAFALAWKDAAGNPADISAMTFSIVLEIPEAVDVTWAGAKSGSTTTWTLNSTQSNLAEGFYSGKLIATDTNGPSVLYEVSVEVQ
jgi:hypothetical protein